MILPENSIFLFDVDILGAVDGSHVRIDPPAENPNAYYNRKKFHSIILQAVCKHDLLFTSIYIMDGLVEFMMPKCYDIQTYGNRR